MQTVALGFAFGGQSQLLSNPILLNGPNGGPKKHGIFAHDESQAASVGGLFHSSSNNERCTIGSAAFLVQSLVPLSAGVTCKRHPSVGGKLFEEVGDHGLSQLSTVCAGPTDFATV